MRPSLLRSGPCQEICLKTASLSNRLEQPMGEDLSSPRDQLRVAVTDVKDFAHLEQSGGHVLQALDGVLEKAVGGSLPVGTWESQVQGSSYSLDTTLAPKFLHQMLQ